MGYFTSDEMTEERFHGKSICHFNIEKEEVKNTDFERIDAFFEELKEYGTVPRQKVFITFSDIDEQKRELIYSPEIIRYTKAFISRHPYFWYYATPVNSEFFYMAILVDGDKIEIADFPFARKFSLKTDPDRIKHLIHVMGINLNIFGEEIDDIEGALESLKAWTEKMLGDIIQKQ